MTSLAETLVAESPRLTPRRVPIASRLIGAIGPILFLALFVQAFTRQSLAVWSIGIAYILYDTALLAFTAWNIRDLRQAPHPAPAMLPSFGVLVAAHNEAGVIAAAIDRLAGQDMPPDLILIADDGSSDATAEVLARRYGLAVPPLGTMTPPSSVLPSLRWLRLRHAGKARALNAAMLQVETEIVLTVDADTLLEPGAIAAMRAAFAAEPTLVAATGVLAPICGRDLQGRFFEWFQTYEYVRNFLSRHAWERLDSLLLISGAFAAFRREAVVAVGGFDPDCMVEDYELIHRLYRHAADHDRDWTIRVVGGALARTDAPASPMAFLRQRRRWFGGFLQTQHWNRDMVGARRFGWLGTAMLPVKALDTVQPIYGLAAFAILVGLVVSGRFTLAFPILLVMLAKIAIDLTFHLWSLSMYKRWTGQREGLALFPALIAAILEPFSFQLLRHAGAVWGWHAFLTGRESWGRQQRTAIVAPAE
ncbi:glycosyltransferase family 2 protein [Sphingomonas glacialis]|uniref:Glycosyltransferase family 2 protein n=1 Tax=Sphingomonas glacialis TaxID=658225 RepID=A0A502G038_9SPHN|nr:glycosyltransferase [Sphingomonas glacialis]TPG55198.1 glycosyltransferase family 2 protein [Sphingomonas glacialis]